LLALAVCFSGLPFGRGYFGAATGDVRRLCGFWAFLRLAKEWDFYSLGRGVGFGGSLRWIAGVTGSSPVPPTTKSAKNWRISTVDNSPSELGWQPIDTAPKDKTAILVWCPNIGGRVSQQTGLTGFHIVARYYDGCLEAEWNGDVIPKPTHWLPLPPPPK
jgi:hypothetical protein